LTATPGLRAKLFANPTRQVGRSLPSGRYWKYEQVHTRNPFRYWWRRRLARREVAQSVLTIIAGEIQRHELAAVVNTDAVFQEFFAPIVEASQRSFSSVTALSWGTFMVGVGLIISGVVVAIVNPAQVNSTVIAGIFGGTGAVSALGSVLASSKQGIREVTVDVARLRMVLTAFATQLGQLRALAEVPPQPGVVPTPPSIKTVTAINDAIATAMKSAVDLIPEISDEPADKSQSKSTATASDKSASGGKRSPKTPTGAGAK
jgi:hypothetical protein